MGNGAHGTIVYRGYGVQGVWATWAIGAQRVWGTRGMDYMGNGVHGQWGTGVWATWAMGHMGDLLPKYQKDVKLSKR